VVKFNIGPYGNQWGVRVMVFNATFNNISVTSISWWSVLLVEETGVPGENTVLPQITGKLYHIFFYRVHFVFGSIRLLVSDNKIFQHFHIKFCYAFPEVALFYVCSIEEKHCKHISNVYYRSKNGFLFCAIVVIITNYAAAEKKTTVTGDVADNKIFQHFHIKFC
jgi:hypothetical protein